MKGPRAAGHAGARFWLPALIALAALAVRIGTIGHSLVWDDLLILRDLQSTVQERGLLGVVTSKFIVTKATYFRPVVMLSFWSDTLLSGSIPVSYHLTNILVHTANAVLVYVLGFHLLGSAAAAFIGALLFAVDPVHTESVAFVSGRTDLFATFFVLIAVIGWARMRCGLETNRLVGTTVGAAALFLGALSKETAFLAPAFLIFWGLIDPARPRGASTWLRWNKPWLISWPCTLAVALLLRSLALSGSGVPKLGGNVSSLSLDNLWGLVKTWLLYVRLLVIPWPLNTYYTENQMGISAATVTGVIIFVAVVWIANRAQPRFGLFVLGWVGCFLLPVAGIVPLNAAVLAERYLYLPSVASCLAIGLALRQARTVPSLRPAAYPATAALVAAMAVGSVAQGAVWKNEETLFRTMVQTSPQASIGYGNLALTLRLQGRFLETIPLYQNALMLEPGSAVLHNDLGNALSEVGRGSEAIDQYLVAIRLNPTMVQAHYNLADSYDQTGQYPAALKEYLEVLRYDPGNNNARLRAGVLLGEGYGAEGTP